MADFKKQDTELTRSHSAASIRPSLSSGSTPDVEKRPETHFQEDFPESGTKAWTVAAGTTGVLFCSFGYVNTWGVYQAYYATHQLAGQSASTISWIGSLQLFFLFGGSMFGGALFDRYGAKVIRVPVPIYIFSIMMTSLCKEYWQFMLAQGLLGGLSVGMVMSPATAAVPQYFRKKRGAALGLAIAGSSLGGVILPVIMSKMLYSSLGFGWTVRILGFILLPILVLSATAITARLPPRKTGFLLPSAFTELEYNLTLLAAFLLVLGGLAPLYLLPTYGISRGMGSELALYLAAIANAASLPGRIIPGLLGDKVGTRNMLTAAAASSSIMIFCWPKATSNASIIVFSAFFGFASGAIISGNATALSSCAKDPRNIGTYLGMGFFVIGIAALVGLPISGALINHYGNFDTLSYLFGAITMAGAMVALCAKLATPEGIFSKT